MPQSVISNTSTSSSFTSRSRSSSISSTCSSSSYASSYSTSSSYSLSSYGSSLRSPSECSSTSFSSSSSTPYYSKPQRKEPISPLFTGLTFFLDKEAFKSLNEKQKFVSLVKDHSGSVSLMLSKKTTHFIVDRPTSLLLSLASNSHSVSHSLITSLPHSLIYQMNSASRLNVPVATLDFIYASINTLTLATQHVVAFGKEIKILAPEIPLLLAAREAAEQEAKSVKENEGEPSPEDVKADLISEVLAAVDISISEDKAKETAPSIPEKPLIYTAAMAPITLYGPLPDPSFAPISINEKDTPCRLMAKIDTVESVSYSFEESRFYLHAANKKSTTSTLEMPTRQESKLGSLWSWGSANKGQLGGGDKMKRWSPHFVDTDFSASITQVACGDAHTAAVTANGDVWAWGCGSSGCLGQGEFRGSNFPLLVDSFVDIKVVMVACGKSHTAVLTDVGTIWSWGSNFAGQLGHSGSDKCCEPKEVFSFKEAVFVACGGNNTAVLTKYGDLYTMGCNLSGQRGIGKRSKNLLAKPTRVTFPDDTKIKYTRIGQGFMGALGMKGELYMWGRNLDNQCGNGCAHDVCSPQKISAHEEVIHFSCGDTHAAYVTNKGEVYTWGWGPVGQLGHPSTTPTCTTPTKVAAVQNVSMVECGARHTVALDVARGKIWVWGANEVGQAGIPTFFENFDDEYESDEEEDEGDYEDAEYIDLSEGNFTWLSPQILESLSKASMISCGRDHTFVIIEEAHVPIQFAKDGNEDALCYWLENNPRMRDLEEEALKAELITIRDDELGSDYSLMHWATYFANEDVLELLAGRWMDPNITDCNGDTPLHICAERDIPFCVDVLLVNGGKPDLKNKNGKTAIHVSVENHTIDVLREMVENSICDKSVVDAIGNTPLHYAIQARHFDMAKFLIESAAQPQILDKSGKTALDYCSIKEASYFKSIAQKNDVFISYAHVDLEFALKIKEFLESYAIKCWMDTTRLEAGSDWRLDIGNGLLSSKLVLYVGSRASVVSDWCIKELHMAKKHNLVIIPIWYQKVEFDSEVRSLIFGRGFLDFSDNKNFVRRGKKLSRKLKHVLGIIKQAKHNPYLDIPVLTQEQLWKQLYLTILIESSACIDAACHLERVLHNSAIFSCTHNIVLDEASPYFAARQENLDHSWGIVFLVSGLKASRKYIEDWWKYAEEKGKRVYICMVHGDATHVKTDDLPEKALQQTAAPIFYLESVTSLQQLIFFVYLSQREEFMAKQVDVMEDKFNVGVTTIKDNDSELLSLRKRYYID